MMPRLIPPPSLQRRTSGEQHQGHDSAAGMPVPIRQRQVAHEAKVLCFIWEKEEYMLADSWLVHMPPGRGVSGLALLAFTAKMGLPLR